MARANIITSKENYILGIGWRIRNKGKGCTSMRMGTGILGSSGII